MVREIQFQRGSSTTFYAVGAHNNFIGGYSFLLVMKFELQNDGTASPVKMIRTTPDYDIGWSSTKGWVAFEDSVNTADIFLLGIFEYSGEDFLVVQSMDSNLDVITWNTRLKAKDSLTLLE